MAKAELNPMFISLRGNLGNLIHYRRYGILCVRSRITPKNPDTPAQRMNRRTFADAVKSWQVLPLSEKDLYNRRARKKPLSGYNLFVSEYLKENLPRSADPSEISCHTLKRYNRRMNPAVSVSSPFQLNTSACTPVNTPYFTPG